MEYREFKERMQAVNFRLRRLMENLIAVFSYPAGGYRVQIIGVAWAFGFRCTAEKRR